MIVVRFKVTCRPGKTEQALGLFGAVVVPARAVPGVVHFDIARDIVDPDSIIATEVFEDRAALDRQESMPEVGQVLAALPHLLAAEPEATIYHVSKAEPHT
jgi:quinol monooxygenase YgiN